MKVLERDPRGSLSKGFGSRPHAIPFSQELFLITVYDFSVLYAASFVLHVSAPSYYIEEQNVSYMPNEMFSSCRLHIRPPLSHFKSCGQALKERPGEERIAAEQKKPTESFDETCEKSSKDTAKAARYLLQHEYKTLEDILDFLLKADGDNLKGLIEPTRRDDILRKGDFRLLGS